MSRTNETSSRTAWLPALGYIAADPQTPTRLWVTTGSGTWIVPDTSVSSPCVVPVTNAPSDPGPISFRPNTSTLYLATFQGQSAPTVQTGTSPNVSGCTSATAYWTTVVNDATYRTAAVFPRGLNVTRGADGYAYVATGGQGLIVRSGL